MPSSVTHSYFAEDIYNKSKIKSKVDLNYLKVFGQGPDPYFFYDFHLSKKSKYVCILPISFSKCSCVDCSPILNLFIPALL